MGPDTQLHHHTSAFCMRDRNVFDWCWLNAWHLQFHCCLHGYHQFMVPEPFKQSSCSVWHSRDLRLICICCLSFGCLGWLRDIICDPGFSPITQCSLCYSTFDIEIKTDIPACVFSWVFISSGGFCQFMWCVNVFCQIQTTFFPRWIGMCNSSSQMHMNWYQQHVATSIFCKDVAWQKEMCDGF